MDYEIREIMENFRAIDQGGVRSFLLTGADRAVLVDTCFGGDLKAVCHTVTDKPITLLTTHSDKDHIGSDEQFSVQYMHPAEFECYRRHTKEQIHARPMWEGDVFAVGAFKLEVILIPGHTPGSIALLEREHGFLLSGDTVQAGHVFMHDGGRNLEAYFYSLQKLDRLRQSGAFHTIYASHGEPGLPADIITDHLALAEEVLSGTAVPAGPAPDWFSDDWGHLPKEESSREDYEALLKQMQRKYLPIVPPFGMSGLVLALGLNRCFRERGVPLRARWGCSRKKMEERLKGMLSADLPAILAVGPNFPLLWQKHRVALYRRDGQDNWVAAAKVKAHFVTITGWEGDWLTLASWGRTYRMRWSEYESYIRRHSGGLVSNLLYLKEQTN